MSLMKLLSVSRSFVSGQNQSGRYRMAEQGVLPKFAPVGRPISLAPKRHPEEPFAPGNGSMSPSNNAAFASALPLPELSSTVVDNSPAVGVGVEAATEAVSKPAAPICVNAVPAATTWFRLRKSPFAAGPADTIRSRLPLHTELSLDAVKPVRNDLSDADLEVVHSRPAPNQAGPPAPSRSGLFKSHRPGFVWSRLTARLFHSERIRV